jgi:hypothetical protein
MAAALPVSPSHALPKHKLGGILDVAAKRNCELSLLAYIKDA